HDVGARGDAVFRRVGRSLVKRDGDRGGVPAVGDRVPGQGGGSALRLRLGALDDPAAQVRHPDEDRLEGLFAAGGGQHRAGGVVPCDEGDLIELVVFFFFAAIAVIFALVVILHRNPVVGALSLVASFFALA